MFPNIMLDMVHPGIAKLFRNIPCSIRSTKAARFGVTGIVVCSVGVLYAKWRRRNALRKKAAEAKRRGELDIKNKLLELEDEDKEEIEQILEMDTKILIAAAQEGKIDPVKIVRAYLYQACSLTGNLNCVTGLIQDAELVASQLNLNHATQCMLYGLPVSLKESLQTKGMDSTVGVAKNIGHPAEDDCVLAKVLKHCGAVPFVKTNLSQLMFNFESSNPVFGTTVNPHNIKFTPGGSSSGEGALIAAGGSVLGFGTDTGGSIRCPSSLCGITGIKPSLNRISMKGLKGLPGRIGPMARNVDTLVLAMRALLCPLMFQLDIEVPPLPFNEQVFTATNKLRIGYYLDDGYNEPAPAMKRAVNIVKQALENSGHTLIPFKVPRTADALNLFFAESFADGCRECAVLVKDEMTDPIVGKALAIAHLPEFVRWFIAKVMGFKWPRIAQAFYLYGGGDCSVLRLRTIQAEGYAYKQEFHDAWMKQGLDAVICPPFPVAAAPLGSIESIPGMFSYTGLYNYLNYPAGVVPITKVNKTDIDALKDHKGYYGDPWDRQIQKASKESLGMPVAVQCVSLPFQDEMCLRVMKEIETICASQ